VYGSQLVLKLVERFPIIIQLGAAVLAFTAAKMIVSEKLLAEVFNPPASYADLARWSVYVICIAGVLLGGWWAAKRAAAQKNAAAAQ
jgi:predicted tellurium resistance membrane protein TerC